MPQMKTKTYRSVAAMLRGIAPGPRTEATIKHINREQAEDRCEAKRLGMTMLEYYQHKYPVKK